MEAVRKFAGTEAEKAVVAPKAQAVLSSFDEFVSHYEVVEGTDEVPNQDLAPPAVRS
jgi:hypothetical protein